MNKSIRNIVATVLSLAIATPFAMQANQPAALQYTDIEINHNNQPQNDDLNIATADLLTLDQEALDELDEAGIEYVGNDDELAQQIIDYAARYLGRPYRHGAKGPSAFDCSGFTSYVFKEHGITLSPSSRTQATQGVRVDREDIRPGDLLFFGGRAAGKTVGHVALAVDVADNGTITFIHASTSKGISYAKYPDGGYYSRRFLGARRVID